MEKWEGARQGFEEYGIQERERSDETKERHVRLILIVSMAEPVGPSQPENVGLSSCFVRLVTPFENPESLIHQLH